MIARLRHGLRGYPGGTPVEVLRADDQRVRASWPAIAARSDSQQVAIMLPGRSTPTIAMLREVEIP